jgi:hypothetical protein
MVKNTHGGSKHKSFAKKHSNNTDGGGGGGGSLRLPQNDLELFAYVSACHGNHFEAMTIKFPKIVTFIRNKFSKHNKFSNTVVRGAIVLIGLREWEAPNFKNADLLFVYDSTQFNLLLNIPSLNISSLISLANPTTTHHDILFQDDDSPLHIPSSSSLLLHDLNPHHDLLIDLDDI